MVFLDRVGRGEKNTCGTSVNALIFKVQLHNKRRRLFDNAINFAAIIALNRIVIA